MSEESIENHYSKCDLVITTRIPAPTGNGYEGVVELKRVRNAQNYHIPRIGEIVEIEYKLYEVESVNHIFSPLLSSPPEPMTIEVLVDPLLLVDILPKKQGLLARLFG